MSLSKFISVNRFVLGKMFHSYTPKPIPPKPYECCGDGCINCVWVEYFDKVKEYEESKNNNGKINNKNEFTLYDWY